MQIDRLSSFPSAFLGIIIITKKLVDKLPIVQNAFINSALAKPLNGTKGTKHIITEFSAKAKMILLFNKPFTF